MLYIHVQQEMLSSWSCCIKCVENFHKVQEDFKRFEFPGKQEIKYIEGTCTNHRVWLYEKKLVPIYQWLVVADKNTTEMCHRSINEHRYTSIIYKRRGVWFNNPQKTVIMVIVFGN